MTWYETLIVGWFAGVVTVVLYIRGRLMERWYVTGRANEKENGYEVLLKKGSKTIIVFRVTYDRPSSPNPDTSFADQLAQARNDARTKAEALNATERSNRDLARKSGTPGGLV